MSNDKLVQGSKVFDFFNFRVFDLILALEPKFEGIEGSNCSQMIDITKSKLALELHLSNREKFCKDEAK